MATGSNSPTQIHPFRWINKEDGMRNSIYSSIMILLLLSFMPQVVWGQDEILTILHVNDSHSHVVPFGPHRKTEDIDGKRGGLARAATLIGQVQATEENVLFLHAGDIFIGDFMFNKYFGVGELQILAALGCDALTLGM